MKIPISDQLKLHFIAQRREILTGLLETGRHYDALLALMEPVEADRERFAESRRKVQEFRRAIGSMAASSQWVERSKMLNPARMKKSVEGS